MKQICLILISIIFNLNFVYSQNNLQSEYCITKEEKELLQLINDYRKTKKLPSIKLNAELTKVAKIHINDLIDNQPIHGKCNMHSWSDKGKWKPCCYTDDHKNAKLMWSKPSELTNYKSNGYEIAFELSSGATPKDALAGWKKSPGHNDVILKKGVFNKIGWKAIGISIKGEYALVWFGEIEDNFEDIDDCN